MSKPKKVFYGVAYFDGGVADTVLDSIYNKKEDAERRAEVVKNEIEDGDMGDENCGNVSVIEIDISKAK